MPHKDDSLTPYRQRLAKEMPDVASAPIRELGLLGKLKQMGLPSGTSLAGMYDPFTGSLQVNPDVARRDPTETMNTLVHEGTHARQANRIGRPRDILKTLTGIGGSPSNFTSRTGQDLYGQNPDEMEAFQAEKDYRARTGQQPPVGQPNFLPGRIPEENRTLWDRLWGNRYQQTYNEKGDTYLKPERPASMRGLKAAAASR